jgi:Rhs element Vgr protein
MPTHSLYDQKTDLVKLTVKIAGSAVSDKVQVHGLSVYKSLYKLSTAKIEIDDGNISDAEFETIENNQYEPGKEVEILLGYHNDEEQVFKGIIVKHSIKISSGKTSKIILECSDKNIKMTGQRKFEYFKDKKDSDIMNALITEQKDVETTKKKHDMVIQHNTTDWDFLISRAQANQMVVCTEAGKVLVKKPTIGSPKVTITYGENIIDMDLSIDARTQVKELKTHSWDPDKQEVVTASGKDATELEKHGSLKGKKIAGDLSYIETELHSTAQLDKEELQEWADSSIMLSRLSRVRGTIKTQGIVINPLDTVELKSLGKYYDGKAFVSGVYHEQREGNWTTEIECGASPDLFVKQKEDINLPVSDGLLPGVHGLFIGKVKKTSGDPEGRYRVLITLPMVDGTNGDGVWARVSNIMATDKHGSWFYPEVNDEVICGALGGDMRFPVILGHLYSKKLPPPESEFSHSEKNHEKGWFTREELLFHFDDKDKIIRIETPGGQKFKLDDKDKSITLEDQHKNKMVMDSKGFEFTGNKKFIVNVAQEVGLTSKSGDVKLEASIGNFKAKGSMGFKIENAAGTKVDATPLGLTMSSSAMATLKGSMVMIN